MKRRIPLSLKDLVKMVIETAVPVVIGLVAEKITQRFDKPTAKQSRRKRAGKKKTAKAKRKRVPQRG